MYRLCMLIGLGWLLVSRLGLISVPIVLPDPTVHAAVVLSPDSAVVRSGSGTLQAGQAITLPVEVLGAQNLGAASVIVGYDPALLTATACRRDPAFDGGLCNLAFDRDGDGQPDAVRFNVVSLTGISTTGVSPLTLVNLTWTTIGHPTLPFTTDLSVQVQTFTDPDSIPLAVTALNGQLFVTVPYRCWLPLVRQN